MPGDGETAGFTLFDAAAAAASNRRCGDCQLCCKLLAVRSIGKDSWTRCKHQKVGKGCTIYRNRGDHLHGVRQIMRDNGIPVPDGGFTTPMPHECIIWSCRWVTGMDTAGMKRPDHVHYVIDSMPDMITVVTDAGQRDVMAMQIWVDPAFPLAHRDPALRAFLAMIAARDGMPAIVRCGPGTATVIAAPCLNVGDDWVEIVAPLPRGTGSGNRWVDTLTAGRWEPRDAG